MNTKLYIIIALQMIFLGLFAQKSSNTLLDSSIYQLPIKQQIDSVIQIPYKNIVENTNSAIDLYLSFIPLIVENNSPFALGTTYSKLSLAYYFEGKYDKSVETALHAINIFDSLNDKVALGGVYGELGYQLKRRDLPQSFKYMRKAISILEQTNDIAAILKTYSNFGVLHEFNNDLDSALYYYRKAFLLQLKLNDQFGIPYSWNKFSGAFLIKKDYDSALYYLNLSTQSRLKNNFEVGLAENYELYGDIYFDMQNFQLAIDYYKKSLDLSTELDFRYLTQENFYNLSKCFEAIGNSQDALKYFKKYSEYKDSLNKLETNKAIANLEVKFETEKTEKELAKNKEKVAESKLKVKQRTYFLFGLSMLLVFVLIGAYQTYKQQKFKQLKLQEENWLKDQLAQIEIKNKIQEERLKISRDLHDNIGSQLTFIISSLDNLKYNLNPADKTIKERIEKVNQFSRQTISQFRDTIWAINKNEISAMDFKLKCLDFITKARESTQIEFEYHCEFDKDFKLDSEKGIHVFRCFQEAINNSIKHSGASMIQINITSDDNKFYIVINDNGNGFNPETIEKSHGLNNMKKRIEKVGGNFEIISELSKGTMVKFTINTDHQT